MNAIRVWPDEIRWSARRRAPSRLSAVDRHLDAVVRAGFLEHDGGHAQLGRTGRIPPALLGRAGQEEQDAVDP